MFTPAGNVGFGVGHVEEKTEALHTFLPSRLVIRGLEMMKAAGPLEVNASSSAIATSSLVLLERDGGAATGKRATGIGWDWFSPAPGFGAAIAVWQLAGGTEAKAACARKSGRFLCSSCTAPVTPIKRANDSRLSRYKRPSWGPRGLDSAEPADLRSGHRMRQRRRRVPPKWRRNLVIGLSRSRFQVMSPTQSGDEINSISHCCHCPSRHVLARGPAPSRSP